MALNHHISSLSLLPAPQYSAADICISLCDVLSLQLIRDFRLQTPPVNQIENMMRILLIWSFVQSATLFFSWWIFTNSFSSAPGQLILNKIVSSNPLYSLHVTTINKNVYQVQTDNKCCLCNISHKLVAFHLNYYDGEYFVCRPQIFKPFTSALSSDYVDVRNYRYWLKNVFVFNEEKKSRGESMTTTSLSKTLKLYQHTQSRE